MKITFPIRNSKITFDGLNNRFVIESEGAPTEYFSKGIVRLDAEQKNYEVEIPASSTLPEQLEISLNKRPVLRVQAGGCIGVIDLRDTAKGIFTWNLFAGEIFLDLVSESGKMKVSFLYSYSPFFQYSE